MTSTLQARLVHRIGEVDAASWNRLSGGRYPHLRHEFLDCMETFGCLGDEVGWQAQHVLLEEQGRLIAAMPLYIKTNSFGEFVFDWSWASAYERAGLNYYPKWIVASPFTPATGPRILVAPEHADDGTAERCIQLAIALAEQAGVSSCHWLFPTEPALLNASNLIVRKACQFHWQNQNYESFEHYLSFFNSRHRKQIRKERRDVAETGVTLRHVPGGELSDSEWKAFFRLYRDTFARHGNYPALTLSFFQALGQRMGEGVRIIFAERQGDIVAASFFLQGEDTLYGRYWGCDEEIPGLHFEACYYQGLDYAIERGLKTFEPGAQGEHKISRGFLPTATWSAHWIAEPGFRKAIKDFVDRETPMVDGYMENLRTKSPFRMPE